MNSIYQRIGVGQLTLVGLELLIGSREEKAVGSRGDMIKGESASSNKWSVRDW